MSENEAELNIGGIKDSFNKVVNFFKQDKVAKISIAIIILGFLIIGILIRIQNISSLKDITNGQYLMADIDPFYWLREATTILQNNGHLPIVDSLRIIQGGTGFVNELLPRILYDCY